MIVRNNYNECLTNFACSIQKYFGLEYKHNTLDYIDKFLKEKKPKNIVTILCDGMGSNIMDRMLEKDSFLVKNRLKPALRRFFNHHIILIRKHILERQLELYI